MNVLWELIWRGEGGLWRNNIELIKCAFLLVKGNDCCCNREKASICPDCILYIVKNMSVSLFLLYSRGTYVDSLDDSFDFLFCRECISVTNPYCAWHSGTCIQLNSTSKRCFSKRLIFYKVTFVQSYIRWSVLGLISRTLKMATTLKYARKVNMMCFDWLSYPVFHGSKVFVVTCYSSSFLCCELRKQDLGKWRGYLTLFLIWTTYTKNLIVVQRWNCGW